MAIKAIYLSNDKMDRLGLRGLDNVEGRFMLMRENKMIDPVVNIMTDKPKHIMTRAEASKIFADHMAWNKESCDLQIDLFVKLGMLEIKEEERTLTLREIAVNFNLDLVKFLTILEENGYSIARDNS